MSKLYPKLQTGGNTPSRQGNTIDDYVFNPLIKKTEEAKNWAIKKATPVVSNIVAKMLPSTTPQFIRNHIYNSYDTVKYPDIATAFSQYGWGKRDLKKHEIEKGVVHVGEEAWKKFLDLPQENKWIQPSPDKPDSSINKNSKFYQLSPQVVDSNYVVNYARSQGKPVGSVVGMNGLSPFVPKSHMSEENFNAIDPLQHFNMEYGKDTKGKYVAIHDKYDFDNKVVDKIGKPFEFYKRYHYQQGGTLSQLGYKRHSPYNQASSLLIDTPTGSITMKEVDHPVIGISKGEIQIMQPEKEYQFKSNKVLEIPMRSLYPKGQNGMRMPKVYTDKNKFIEANQSYQDSLYLHNVPSLYKENLATEEGAKDVVLNKALPVLKRILNRNNINLEDYVGEWDSENLKFPRPNQPIIFKPKMQQGGTTPEMSPEQQQEIVRRVRNLRKKLPKMGVAYDPISFRHAMYVNKKAFDKEDQELLGAFDEDTMVKLMNEIPNDNQPTYKKGGSIKGKSKMYPKCKCGCGGVSVGKNKMFQQGGTMDVLDEDGNSQMTITGGERIFSRIATKKMLQLNEEGNYKELGKFICDELYLQDKREPQYVKE